MEASGEQPIILKANEFLKAAHNCDRAPLGHEPTNVPCPSAFNDPHGGRTLKFARDPPVPSPAGPAPSHAQETLAEGLSIAAV